MYRTRSAASARIAPRSVVARTPMGSSPHSPPASTPAFSGSYTSRPARASEGCRITSRRARVPMLPVAHCTTRIVIRVTVCENPSLIERTMAGFRAELHVWLDAHHHELAPRYAPPGTLDDQIAQMQRVKAILFDAGWMRYGWPERVGGLG